MAIGSKPKLDFLIIGAQKGGTTTLHEILKQHPDIVMPEGKEWPYFNEDPKVQFSDYFFRVFGKYEPSKIYGKATPRYLNIVSSAKRIHSAFPDIKIIAILREPVSRTYSHFNMCVRRGSIKDDFDLAVSQWLNADALEAARCMPHSAEAETKCCVAWSEYSRTLSYYKDLFPVENILILFLQDLEERPKQVFDRIFDFLGVGKKMDDELLGKRSHVGGKKRRIFLPAGIKKVPGVKFLTWLFFKSMPRRVAFAYETWNVVPEGKSVADLHPEAVSRLRSHFSSESEKLFELFGIKPTWK